MCRHLIYKRGDLMYTFIKPRKKYAVNGVSMFRIWGRIEKEHKIIRQTTYESVAKFEWGDFFTYLSDICEALDIATPVLLKTHIFNYAKFNRVTFLPRDFTEPVSFDKLILENIAR